MLRLHVAPSDFFDQEHSQRRELMFESAVDVVRYCAAGAAGGLIYWAVREHGAIFGQLWMRITQR
jgi:hypothetical protein